MSGSVKVLRTLKFLSRFWTCWENPSKSLRAAEKNRGAAEKNKEKVEANCTGFSAEFFGSQSVEMFCFAMKIKIQMYSNVDNFFPELDKNQPTSS